MKRIFVFALAAAMFTACDNKNTSETTVTTSDTSAMSSGMNADTATMTDGTTTTTMSGDATTTNRYVPAEGDVMYRDKKLMVWRNGAYVQAETDVTTDNGVIVRRNGEVTRNGDVVILEDGQTYSRSGRFFNSAGEAIEDGWDAKKKGVKKAGQAIKKGANKVGEEVKDVVN